MKELLKKAGLYLGLGGVVVTNLLMIVRYKSSDGMDMASHGMLIGVALLLWMKSKDAKPRLEYWGLLALFYSSLVWLLYRIYRFTDWVNVILLVPCLLVIAVALFLTIKRVRKWF